jgi:hypothetical protein
MHSEFMSTLPLTSIPFTLIILEIGSHFLPRPASATVLLFMIPEVTGMISVQHPAEFFLY